MSSPAAVAAQITEVPSSRLTELVIEVVTHDLHNARTRGKQVFSYESHDREDSIARGVRNWLRSGDESGLGLGLSARQNLVRLLLVGDADVCGGWCFDGLNSDEYANDLAYWLARVRAGDPRFGRCVRGGANAA
ncbi:hypothetical protein GCM10010985_30810 [Caballeronia grimmiae]|uniref:Uncharacterized protein n=1 Tax=Caballeronia grimmiae TaxID=1071679 RepID=A0ABQ1RL57_9BURK|nr:hypothetical protein GCM10010985_30810 [Caballeronia grimmiae]